MGPTCQVHLVLFPIIIIKVLSSNQLKLNDDDKRDAAFSFHLCIHPLPLPERLVQLTRETELETKTQLKAKNKAYELVYVTLEGCTIFVWRR